MWCLLLAVLSVSAEQAFNFYLLEMEWKPASCLNPKQCTNSAYQSDDFNLHGLWPTFAYNEHDPNCCLGVAFEVEKIEEKTLESMQKLWMSYKNSAPRGCQEKVEVRKQRQGGSWLYTGWADDSSYYSSQYSESDTVFHSEKTDFGSSEGSYSTKFWKHEWEKHGTCSNLSINEYFSTAVSLFQTLNVKGSLVNAGIGAGSESSVEKVLAALGEYAVILCVKGNGVSNLKTVRFCYTKDLKLMKCPAAPLSWGCNGQIRLPASTS